MFSSIITTNIKLSSKFNYKGFNFGIKIGDFMKKIVCYLLISNLLISQDNVESLKEEALPNEDNVIENVNQDGDTGKENEDIINNPPGVENLPNAELPQSKSIELEVIPNTEEIEIENNLEYCESDSKSNEISGLTYFDFSYSDDMGIFDIKRTFLNFSKKLSDQYNYTLVLDVGQDISHSYLRNAQIEIQPKQNSTFYLGIIDMNMFDVQQNTWGYRYIKKSAMEQYNFSPVADLGFGYKLRLNNFSLSTLLTNGEGYKTSVRDEFQKLSLQFLYGNKNLRSVRSGNAFNVGLSMSVEPFEDTFLNDADGGFITYDGDGNPTDLEDEIFEGMNSAISLFGGFTMQTFMGGLEINTLNSFDKSNPIEFGADGQELGGDDTITSSSTYGDIKTSSLISTYFSFGITPKFNMFLRADIFDNNNAADVENDSETRVLLGFHFPISENMDLAPVLKYNIVEANDDPATDEDESASIDFGVNFQFRF